jgi:cytochrome b pre-mRNA-processing protein 3
VLTRFFRRSRQQRTVADLYGRLVAQARQPGFFLHAGVPDTIEGRFELIALHGWLVMRRLGREGRDAAELSQALFDYMFADMDTNLREAGVSDLKVGEKVKELARHFYGRVKAYEDGLMPGAAEAVLTDALDRNLLGSTLPDPAHVARMAAYVRREAAALDAGPVDRLLAGEVAFGPPPGDDPPADGDAGKQAPE